jgi:hypothetical protein
MAMARSLKDQNRDGSIDDDKKEAAGAVGGALAGGAAGGVAGGALAGAAAGGLTGPAGAAIGAAVGAVAGALGGKAIADQINPKAEDEYWRKNYSTRSYVQSGSIYDDYAPAYRMGYERYSRYQGRSFDDVEPELRRDWDSARGASRLTWEQAKHATREAFERAGDAVERAIPGDSDRDGR